MAPKLPPLPPPHVPSRHAYPVCCGAPTRLSVFGWHCASCGVYHPFRDAHGRQYEGSRRRLEKKGA
jgi:hypothetical protein